MSGRWRITVTVSERVISVRGWRVLELLNDAGLKGIHSGAAGGWMLDRHKLADLLAYLDTRHVGVRVIDEREAEAGAGVTPGNTSETPAPELEGEASGVEVPLW